MSEITLARLPSAITTTTFLSSLSLSLFFSATNPPVSPPPPLPLPPLLSLSLSLSPSLYLYLVSFPFLPLATFIKNFLLVEPMESFPLERFNWYRAYHSVGNKGESNRGWRRRADFIGESGFFSFEQREKERVGTIKGFCLSDWRCKCGFDGKFLMAGQRQWECSSGACLQVSG